MAESEVQQPPEPVEEQETKIELKYVDFIQVATLHFLAYIASIYQTVKDYSGPLKSCIQFAESVVKYVSGPIYRKFHDVSIKTLKFLDHEMDCLNRDFHQGIPSVLRGTSGKWERMFEKGPKSVRELAADIQRDGVCTTAKKTADKLYSDYEAWLKVQYEHCVAKIVEWMVTIWWLLNLFPLFHQLAHIFLPWIRSFCEKYNEYLAYAWEKGYAGSRYLPYVPVEKISKTFGDGSKSSATSGDESRTKQE